MKSAEARGGRVWSLWAFRNLQAWPEHSSGQVQRMQEPKNHGFEYLWFSLSVGVSGTEPLQIMPARCISETVILLSADLIPQLKNFIPDLM